MMDLREVFATLRDSCLAKMKDIRDYVMIRYGICVSPNEVNTAKRMRTALEKQLARMEVIRDKMRKYVLIHSIDADHDIVLAEITGMMKHTRKAAAMTFLMMTQLTRVSPEWGEAVLCMESDVKRMNDEFDDDTKFKTITREEARGEGNPDDGGFPELGDDLEEPELLTDSY